MLSILFLSSIACNTGPDVSIKTYNNPPTVVFLSPGDGDVFDESTTIHFQAKISDSYDLAPELDFVWSSDQNGELLGGTPADINGNLTYSTANLNPGNHVISLTVIDSDGASASSSIQIFINDLPEAPTIDIIHPDESIPESTNEGEGFELAVSVWDARDPLNTLIVDMVSDQDGFICSVNPNDSGFAYCDSDLSSGTHNLEFTVTNSLGYDATASTYFSVIAELDIDNDHDGFTENQGDCDDANATINPIAVEVANGYDDNCNNLIDEGTINYDDDGDGFTETQGDCNDNNPYVAPNLPEVCGNSVDDNCNGSQNEQNASSCTTYYRDADNDNYGDGSVYECWCQPGGSTGEFTTTNNTDCYDDNYEARPGQTNWFATDRGDNSFDYDCNGSQAKEITSTGECGSLGGTGISCGAKNIGWDGTTPACGVSKNYIDDDGDCDSGFFSCDPYGNTFRTQRCR